MWSVEMIGWTADVCFLLGYFLVSQGKIKGEGKLFNYLNLVGAVLFGTYAIIKSAVPILVLECFWGTIALIALYKAYFKKALVRKFVVFLCLLLAPSFVQAQKVPQPKGEGHVWLDLFGGTEGAVLYPQYGWRLETGAGRLNGFGFVETAPHEPFFTNHLVVYSPGKQRVFSLHTETGGLPEKNKWFFQAGPRLNLHEAMPEMKKGMDRLFLVWLPPFAGIRTNNFLLAGGTNKFSVSKNVQMSVEGYRRFFPDGPDYAEYWALLHPKAGRFSPGVFFLHSGERTSFGFGGRLAMF